MTNGSSSSIHWHQGAPFYLLWPHPGACLFIGKRLRLYPLIDPSTAGDDFTVPLSQSDRGADSMAPTQKTHSRTVSAETGAKHKGAKRRPVKATLRRAEPTRST